MPKQTTVTHRALAILKLPKRMSNMITYAQGIVTALNDNPSFKTPSPTLAEVTTAINDLQTAETAAATRAKGTNTARNDKRTALLKLLQQLRSYVQSVADSNAEKAATLITNAGMVVRKTPVHKPRVFTAEPGAVSGSAKLTAVSAGPRACYDWESSLDGGKTWVAAASTLQAKTTLVGFTPGVTVMFRFRPVTKTGEGNWSQPVSLIVR
jgi:hypothetical protein